MIEISYIIKAIDYSEDRWVLDEDRLTEERWAAKQFNSEVEAVNFIEEYLPSDKCEIVKHYYKN